MLDLIQIHNAIKTADKIANEPDNELYLPHVKDCGDGSFAFLANEFVAALKGVADGAYHHETRLLLHWQDWRMLVKVETIRDLCKLEGDTRIECRFEAGAKGTTNLIMRNSDPRVRSTMTLREVALTGREGDGFYILKLGQSAPVAEVGDLVTDYYTRKVTAVPSDNGTLFVNVAPVREAIKGIKQGMIGLFGMTAVDVADLRKLLTGAGLLAICPQQNAALLVAVSTKSLKTVSDKLGDVESASIELLTSSMVAYNFNTPEYEIVDSGNMIDAVEHAYNTAAYEPVTLAKTAVSVEVSGGVAPNKYTAVLRINGSRIEEEIILSQDGKQTTKRTAWADVGDFVRNFEKCAAHDMVDTPLVTAATAEPDTLLLAQPDTIDMSPERADRYVRYVARVKGLTAGQLMDLAVKIDANMGWEWCKVAGEWGWLSPEAKRLIVGKIWRLVGEMTAEPVSDFDTRMAQLPQSDGGEGRHRFSLRKARYAKDKVAIHAPADGALESEAGQFVRFKLNGRYSRRERAYIVSISQAERFVTVCLGLDHKVNA